MSFRATKTALRKQHDKAIRAGLRDRRKKVALAIKQAKAGGRASLAKVREQCRRSKARLSERAKGIREQHRDEANAEIGLLRESANRACSTAKDRTRKATGRKLAELKAQEREAVTDILRERNVMGHVRKQERRRLPDVHVETDEEVAYNIEPELRPVWHSMKGAFKKPTRLKSRTEQFLEWAEENPSEVLELQGALADEATDELVAEQQEQQARIDALLRQTTLDVDDLADLGISRATLHDAGYDSDNPVHVRAFLTGAEPPGTGHNLEHNRPVMLEAGDPYRTPSWEEAHESFEDALTSLQSHMVSRRVPREAMARAEAELRAQGVTQFHGKAKDAVGWSAVWFRGPNRELVTDGSRPGNQEPPQLPKKRAQKGHRAARGNASTDAQTLRAKLLEMGGMREEEAAAALGWNETRVWNASKAGLKAKLFERSAVNRELHVPGEQSRDEKLSAARFALGRAERATGVERGSKRLPPPAPPENPVTLVHPTEPWRRVTLRPAVGGYVSRLSTGDEFLISSEAAAEHLRNYLSEGWVEATAYEEKRKRGERFFLPAEPERFGWVPSPRIPAEVANKLDRDALRRAVEQDLADLRRAQTWEQTERGGTIASELLRNASDGAPGPVLMAAVLPGAIAIRAELRRQLGDRVTEDVPRETFDAARGRLMHDLQWGGWKLAKQGAKVPKFTSEPSGETTLWLKPQAVYVAYGRGASLGNARSLVSDIRNVSAAQLTGMAERLGAF